MKRQIVEMLRQLQHDGDGFVFTAPATTKAPSTMAIPRVLACLGRGDVTTHDFRSSFRDWCAERTSDPSEVAEMALAHAVCDKVEAADRRGDLFDKRRRLAEEWARFCAAPKPEGNVRAIRAMG